MLKIINISFLFFLCSSLFSQTNNIDKDFTEIYNTALLDGKTYEWLEHLSNQIGGRLSGSFNAQRAVEWAKEELESLELDSVWLQPVMVPKWVRGTFEYASIESSPGNTINVPVCALGGSVATPSSGISANVIEVKDFKELERLGTKKIQGKIVFFNRPMRPELINTFDSYSQAVNQRFNGAEKAAKYGAKAVIVGSMNLRLDDYPHTGSMSYGNLKLRERIPAAAISTNGAELLSSMLSLNPNLKFFLKQNCKNYPDVLSYNVIGDLRIFKKLKFKPKKTIRAVFFMNEENGLRGALAYANHVKKINEKHLFALESDAGGFSPRGFSFDCKDNYFKKIISWKKYFEPYMVDYFIQGGSGADIGPLKNSQIVLPGLRPDSQRYFEYHHSDNDTFEAINKRELELGAAAMTALIHLVDTFGIE